ncbi:hypothetical protein VMCG_07506 [Cytospora schulzeri]|uniref:F-box domain-containing protein n=1 Tax=Cytospora schulzeri TaxID=448051 RepID=A0A423W1D0_9PEZI|nr:hypothetical protein VMCG_07506 [Valsa malicola]
MNYWHDYPRPLGFRHVMEGRPPAAQGSRLFFLPAEIHDLIFGFVAKDRDDLATLALVNSDCRQIARSYQFCTVTFTGSLTCEQGILALLQREAIERRQDRGACYGRTRKPSLGVCIRKVIAGDSGLDRWLYFHTRSPAGQSEQHHAWWQYQLSRIIEYQHRVYRPAVLSVMASLPNLDEAIILRNGKIGAPVLDEHLLNCLAGSTLRELELKVTMVERCPQVAAGVTWPLESLDLRLEWDERVQNGGVGLDVSAYCDCILRLCCADLERLRIRLPITTPGSSWCYPVHLRLQFPRLRRLDLLEFGNLQHMGMSSLLTTSRCLAVLSIDCSLQRVQTFLRHTDAIPTLRVLILLYKARPRPPPLTAQGGHPHPASRRRRLQGLTTGVLERIVSIISRNTGLKKVSMTFEDVSIPPAELRCLAALEGPELEELHIGAGWADRPRRPGWLVDHGELRRILVSTPGARAATRKLTSLSLTGDASRCLANWGMTGYCSYERSVSEEHRSRMRREALAYARALPELEVVYIGVMGHGLARLGGAVTVGWDWEDVEFDPAGWW